MNFFRFFLILTVITIIKCEENVCEITEEYITNSTFVTCQVINFCCGNFHSENITAINFPQIIKISHLPDEIYKNFPNLQILNATNNSIEIVQYKNFMRLLKLEVIDLSYNKIKIITKQTFVDLPALRVIHLSKFLFFLFS